MGKDSAGWTYYIFGGKKKKIGNFIYAVLEQFE
jgi:hypothetical protein